MEKGKKRCAVKNRRSKAGETLAETLVTMLIVGLSSVLFLTMVAASGKIFRMAEKRYGEVYEIITEADRQVTDTELTDTELTEITVQGKLSTATVDVNWYGDTNYVLSYKVK